MRMFTDNPITSVKEDAFGFAPFAQVMREAILQTEPLPFSVGIFGAWGSGKSSFMRLLELLIANKPEVRSIWFDPWKYDKKEDLWSAMIQSILYRIAGDTGDPEVKDKAKRLALAATWLAVKKAVNTVTAGIISETNMDELAKVFGNKNEEYYRHINYFEKNFSEMVDRYTDGGKLVIFIDDLDRCLPENAITVLESLKLFIGDARCIFVLGMDHYIVEQGIKHRYDAEKMKLNGRDYLDKIIQVPFYLPPVPFDKLQISLKKSLEAGGTYSIFTEEIWNIVRFGMDSNPRKTKRFVNCFNLAQHFLRALTRDILLEGDHAPSLSPETQNIYLAKLLIFQMTFPDFYQHLRLHPGDWKHLEEDIILENDNINRNKVLKANPALETFLKDDNFGNFIRETSSTSDLNYPKAPSAQIVLLLLQTINLVADKQSQSL